MPENWLPAKGEWSCRPGSAGEGLRSVDTAPGRGEVRDRAAAMAAYVLGDIPGEDGVSPERNPVHEYGSEDMSWNRRRGGLPGN